MGILKRFAVFLLVCSLACSPSFSEVVFSITEGEWTALKANLRRLEEINLAQQNELLSVRSELNLAQMDLRKAQESSMKAEQSLSEYEREERKEKVKAGAVGFAVGFVIGFFTYVVFKK